MKIKRILMSATLLGLSSIAFSQQYHLKSPDNNLSVTISVDDQVRWSVSYKDTDVLLPSEIGMVINQDQEIGKNAHIRRRTESAVDRTITAVVPVKASQIRDQFNQVILQCRGDYSIEFRAFNDGVAYRFVTNMNKDIYVSSETAAFNFAGNPLSYFPEEESLVSHYERAYKHVRLDTIPAQRFCSLPALVEVSDVKVLITEADLYDYPCMFLYGHSSNGLRAGFPPVVLETQPKPGSEDRNEDIVKTAEYIARTSGARSFPWRVCIIGDDKTLLETNLVYQLSRENKLTDVSWIKPGKVAWDWYNALNIYGVDFPSGINTDTYKYYIDFAATFGLNYIILDEGWSRTTTHITEANPDIDIAELVKYGASKNIGVILWMLWKPLDENLESILNTYATWRIKGIKVDFMQRADQYMVNFYERVTEAASRHKLLVDFHGAFKPSGLPRAYPNMISSEGVKGNENNKWSRDVTPEHTVILPFTRMVAGAMDFTPGAMANAQLNNYHISFTRPMSLGTRCHQVAMYIVFESPLQMLCDAPSTYYREKETTAFISKIPTVWDQTVALQARVADYLAVARRRSNSWYVGAMTDWTPRELTLDFSFLGEGLYEIEIMQDGINAAKYAQDYRLIRDSVDRSTKMKIHLAPGGGWAAIVTKK
jgi:alpha-glucosidase